MKLSYDLIMEKANTIGAKMWQQILTDFETDSELIDNKQYYYNNSINLFDLFKFLYPNAEEVVYEAFAVVKDHVEKYNAAQTPNFDQKILIVNNGIVQFYIKDILTIWSTLSKKNEHPETLLPGLLQRRLGNEETAYYKQYPQNDFDFDYFFKEFIDKVGSLSVTNKEIYTKSTFDQLRKKPYLMMIIEDLVMQPNIKYTVYDSKNILFTLR